MKFDEQKLKDILEGYGWIRIKKFDPTDLTDINKPADLYEKLLNHHNKETEFLINVCKDLAKELLYEKFNG